MTMQSSITEPGRVDEPRAAQDYSAMLSRVAAERKPVIVQRNGEDLAAVIPLEYLEWYRELEARQEADARHEDPVKATAEEEQDQPDQYARNGHHNFTLALRRHPRLE